MPPTSDAPSPTAEAPKPELEFSVGEATEAVRSDESDDSDDSSDEAAGSAPAPDNVLSAIRLLLKPNKRGSGVSGEVGFLARTLEKNEGDFLAALTAVGVVVPTDSEEKPTFVEQGGEIFWLNKNSADGSLWMNAKAAKSARKSAGPRSRGAKKKKTEESESS
jgi:hypothetical protein